jgi:hypothetical protein
MEQQVKQDNDSIVIKKKHLVVLLLLLLLLLCAGLALGPNWNTWFGSGGPAAAGDIVAVADDFTLDPDAEEYTGEKPPNAGGMDTGIRMPGWAEVKLHAGEPLARIQLLNPEGNECYMRFTFGLADADSNLIKEVLYESDYIAPGQVITKQDLSRGLAVGTYDAVVRIDTTTMDDTHTPLNGGNVIVKLIVN